MILRATYRLQFHRGFGFAEGARLGSYLAHLGISHLYSSPIQTARSGSVHGYDIVDHATFNAELGGRQGFVDMAKALKDHGVRIILDIVPNHMFVGDGTNAWWQDVLKKGRQSRFAHYFDIDWDPPDPRLRGKVLLPFLGSPYAETLASGELELAYDPARSELLFVYHDHRFPLRAADYPEVLRGASPERADLSRFSETALLHELLERQNYVLAWWQSAGDRCNWRRFFDISELAGLRIEEDEIFEAVHALPFELYENGLVDGFRIDHIDGLADPAGYCRRLRARLGTLKASRPSDASPGPAYLVVEKILSSGETLPSDWGVDGTTGYDFLGEVSALLHDARGEQALESLWRRMSRRSGKFEQEQRAARLSALDADAGRLDATARAFSDACLAAPEGHDLSEGSVQRALRLLISNLDIYRTYLTGAANAPLPGHLEHAGARAAASATAVERRAIRSILAVLTGQAPTDPAARFDATRRFNQLACTVAAKGVEDTAFYRHAVLISRNDVGSDPAQFSISPATFHALCARRHELLPHAMLATATHDHKRGEDTRARLAVLSEIPERWEVAVNEWFELTDGQRTELVEPAECYHLFQTLIGSWPYELAVGDKSALAEYRRRILTWRTKSLREAKLRTSWADIDTAYERAHADYVNTILDPRRSTRFLESLKAFVDDIAAAGAANSLAQTVLRLTTPGVPDTYQGTEFWDLSLVDPDNRRPVDFLTRQRLLDDDASLSKQAKSWRDGRIKQTLIARLLAERASDPDVLGEGTYVPLEVRGRRSPHLLAFARLHRERAVLVGVARCVAGALIGRDGVTPPADWWADTHLLPPAQARCNFVDVLEPEQRVGRAQTLAVSSLMSDLPLFVLRSEGEFSPPRASGR